MLHREQPSLCEGPVTIAMSDIELKTHVVTNSLHSGSVCDAELGDSHTSSAILSWSTSLSTDPGTQTLLHYCARNYSVVLFLRATANYWSIDGSYWSADGLYYGLTRFINVASIVVNIYYVFDTLFAPNYPNESERYASAGINFAAILRTVSVVIVQYLNQCRMQKPAHGHEILVVEESAKIAGIFGLIVLLTNVISTILLAFSSVTVNAGLQVTEYFLGTYLTFNLFFLIVDVKASSVLLDQLHLLADSKILRMEAFLSAKNDIRRRVKESRWACDLVFVPCVASAVCILVLIIYFLDTPAVRPAVKIEASAFVCILLKELLFVMVAFWYVAKVNGRADELTIKLSRNIWGPSEPLLHRRDTTDTEMVHNSAVLDSNGNVLSHRKMYAPSSVMNVENEVVHATDIQRLSIHASSISEPISFTLLFKRVSWKNVAVSAAGFIVAIFIAVVKNAIEQTVES